MFELQPFGLSNVKADRFIIRKSISLNWHGLRDCVFRIGGYNFPHIYPMLFTSSRAQSLC